PHTRTVRGGGHRRREGARPPHPRRAEQRRGRRPPPAGASAPARPGGAPSGSPKGRGAGVGSRYSLLGEHPPERLGRRGDPKGAPPPSRRRPAPLPHVLLPPPAPPLRERSDQAGLRRAAVPRAGAPRIRTLGLGGDGEPRAPAAPPGARRGRPRHPVVPEAVDRF